MKTASLFLTMCGFALAQLALAQTVPIYRITVVARTTKAINYITAADRPGSASAARH